MNNETIVSTIIDVTRMESGIAKLDDRQLAEVVLGLAHTVEGNSPALLVLEAAWARLRRSSQGPCDVCDYLDAEVAT